MRVPACMYDVDVLKHAPRIHAHNAWRLCARMYKRAPLVARKCCKHASICVRAFEEASHVCGFCRYGEACMRKLAW